MAGPTKFRQSFNRRRQDPQNFKVGPQAAAVYAYGDGANNAQFIFNCPVNAAMLNTTGWRWDGAPFTAVFTQITDLQVTAVMSITVAENQEVLVDLRHSNAFGPNITGCQSALFSQVL